MQFKIETAFLQFLFKKVYNSVFDPAFYEEHISEAEEKVRWDYHYHYPELPEKALLNLIQGNTGWLAVFLYRFGNSLFKKRPGDPLLTELHWLLREVCGMEIYFSIDIDEGFEIRHGLGSVIGSRCKIGKGFVIHQGCTVGHRIKFGNGPVIGNNVEMGAKSAIIGEINIGHNVLVGANSLVLHSVENNSKVFGVK